MLDRGLLGSAYAVAFNSPLLGPSRYRFSRTSGPTGSALPGRLAPGDPRRGSAGSTNGSPATRTTTWPSGSRAQGLEVRYDAGAVVGYVAGRSLPGDAPPPLLVRLVADGPAAARAAQGLAPRHVVVVAGVAAHGRGRGVAARPRRPRPPGALGTAVVAYARGRRRRLDDGRHGLAAARPDLDLARFHPLGVAAAPALAAAADAGGSSGAWVRRAAGRVRRSSGAAAQAGEP